MISFFIFSGVLDAATEQYPRHTQHILVRSLDSLNGHAQEVINDSSDSDTSSVCDEKLDKIINAAVQEQYPDMQNQSLTCEQVDEIIHNRLLLAAAAQSLQRTHVRRESDPVQQESQASNDHSFRAFQPYPDSRRPEPSIFWCIIDCIICCCYEDAVILPINNCGDFDA